MNTVLTNSSQVDLSKMERNELFTHKHKGAESMKKYVAWPLGVFVLGIIWTIQCVFPNLSLAMFKLGDYEAGTIRKGVTVAKLRTNQFVTAVRLGDGRLKLITWKVNLGERPTLERLKSYTAGRIAEHGIALDAYYGFRGRFVTAVRLPNDNLKVIDWYVDESGTISRLSSAYLGQSREAGVFIHDKGTDIGIREMRYYHSVGSSTITRHILVAARLKETGKLKLYSLIQQGNNDVVGGLRHVDSYTAGSIRGNTFNRSLPLARVQGQAVTAVRLTKENLKIIAWDLNPGSGKITRTGDWTAGRIFGVEITRGQIYNGPGASPPDFLTACRLKDGKLKLIGWELLDGQPIRRDDLKTSSMVTEAALGVQAHADEFVTASVNNAVPFGDATLKTFSLGNNGVLIAKESTKLSPAMRDVAVVQSLGVSSDGTIVRYTLVAGQKPSSDPNQGHLVLSVWNVANGGPPPGDIILSSETTDSGNIPVPYLNIGNRSTSDTEAEPTDELISFSYRKATWRYGSTDLPIVPNSVILGSSNAFIEKEWLVDTTATADTDRYMQVIDGTCWVEVPSMDTREAVHGEFEIELEIFSERSSEIRSNALTFPGIGKLVLAKRKAQVGRNPQTGAAIKIPAKKVVKFCVANSIDRRSTDATQLLMLP